ncbi:hypothetical protein HJC23_002266 [Cyclotella cryptica]|uniref:S-adenosyl-L-methionine-dependent methyltransferase n=1 Tax=Cyclotella cryptica TaxID=29204 RepID=A0ABD3QGZ3_9STRA|eukprot:CCRYP_005724-RA/>CCRYP_005724-RA protein AED:0.07 eAED:0.07 QI:0/-1/0/1/-1/1/1/0/437
MSSSLLSTPFFITRTFQLVPSLLSSSLTCYCDCRGTISILRNNKGIRRKNYSSLPQRLTRLAASKEETDSLWENSQSSLLGSLLKKTTSRAIRTLSTTTRGDWDDVEKNEGETSNHTIRDAIDAAIVRSSSTLNGEATTSEEPTSTEEADKTSKPHQDKRTYLNNPCVTPTALAHSLWRSTIIPYHDTVIDATCGNGKDCLALIRMMFPNDQNDAHDADVHPQLIGIDIQSRAISNTRRSLLSALPPEIYYNHVKLLEQSHEHLLKLVVPRDDGKRQEVGLICYNLGYLPGSSGGDINTDYKDCKTQTQTTLSSITDAALILRVGGLLSVMTYPGSNLEESISVEHFVEGLAMLTTRDEGGWRGYLRGIPDYSLQNDDDPYEKAATPNRAGRVRDVVTRSIERVVSNGPPKQTWRVFVHKPLGRPQSPILMTAHRIK